ncbi:MAG: SUKH-4 family immunity protein [Planctomycetaceae bacterium]|nr:SUKH-4 family immunity protein [Planctomycetaceae bacterium]
MEFGLPRTVTIACYNDITLTFSGTVTPLSTIWNRDLHRGFRGLGEMPREWSRFWHLADQEYLQGGGWICVEESSGRLVVIDLDLPTPIYLLNTNLRNFYTTLAHFLEWSERTGGSPAATIRLRDNLLQQDVIPPEELEPFWMNLIDATLDGDPINLTVALDPGRR